MQADLQTEQRTLATNIYELPYFLYLIPLLISPQSRRAEEKKLTPLY